VLHYYAEIRARRWLLPPMGGEMTYTHDELRDTAEARGPPDAGCRADAEICR